ncbi:DNA circularization N-terminal domain-containing protein [Pararhizobium sp. O133]|uniref:DNA circularization N-terminal domain-containing protein n=1 Tax=Pararhizobium sp. O133 TaxID=3449278 RepID=UPI003F68570B
MPASFRGVPFYVEVDDRAGGRRLAVHEYAGGEISLIEDMGRATESVDVTAYVLGDVADFQSHALFAVCGLPGPGFLMLPIDGGRMMHCQEFSRSRFRDRAGYIAVDLHFVPAGIGAGSFLSIGDVAASFSNDIVDAALGFAGMF